MRIHTDVLTRADLLHALPELDVHCESTPRGSRSRDHAIDAHLVGYGARHTRRTGRSGAGDARAAT